MFERLSEKLEQTFRKLKGYGKISPEQVQDPLLDNVGNTGVASPLMILISALEDAKPGDRFLLVTWGTGCDAVVLKTTDQIEKIRDRRGIKNHLASKMLLPNYGKYLRYRDLLEWAIDIRPPRRTNLTIIWREHEAIFNFHGHKCRACGDIQYPKRRVCQYCQARDNFATLPIPNVEC